MTTTPPEQVPELVLAAWDRHQRATALLARVIDASVAQSLELDCDAADRLVAGLGLLRLWPAAHAVTVAHAAQDAEHGQERHGWLHGDDSAVRRHPAAVTAAALADDNGDDERL